MDIKRIIRNVAIMTFMIFTISSVTENSYAYWASNITPPVSDTTIGTVTVGSWTFSTPWVSGTSYTAGDIVSHNGNLYQAKKSGILKEPGVGSWKSDWTLL